MARSGALRINRAAVEAVRRWAGRGDLHVRHVIGARDWDELTAAAPVPPGSPLRYEAVEYDDDMPTSLAAADVVVCRSGASTSFELLAAGLPSMLVPSPFVTADHQTANARHLERAGAAVVVPDAELDGGPPGRRGRRPAGRSRRRLAAMAHAARAASARPGRRRHRRPGREVRP